jgi:hypothetical protein
LLQILVRGGQYPDVYVVCLTTSETFELLLLQNA